MITTNQTIVVITMFIIVISLIILLHAPHDLVQSVALVALLGVRRLLAVRRCVY